MKIQNTTNEEVVYEAKDGGPGAGDTPLKNVTNERRICNGHGCAGLLANNNPENVPEVDKFKSVRVRIYRKGATGAGQTLHEAFTKSSVTCLYEVFETSPGTLRLRHVSLI